MQTGLSFDRLHNAAIVTIGLWTP